MLLVKITSILPKYALKSANYGKNFCFWRNFNLIIDEPKSYFLEYEYEIVHTSFFDFVSCCLRK